MGRGNAIYETRCDGASIEGSFKNEPGGGMTMGVRDAGMELAMSERVMENCRRGLIN